ncbi:MAG: ribosome maturation factor RimP [Cyclobacteriaceae bacterium]|nr:MAG: ribosome maturation factor RimP [Cyclobacteriaceae bacterium]
MAIKDKSYTFASKYDQLDEGTQKSPLCFIGFMDLVERIKELAAVHLKDESQFLVEVVASLKKKPFKLIVIVDGDNGVTIDDCAELSRALSAALDEENLFNDPYMLEVSTPGLDHPLKLTRQYQKNVGRTVKVKTKTLVLQGKLVAVTPQEITVEVTSGTGKKKEVKEVTIPFSDIEKTFVMVSFK